MGGWDSASHGHPNPQPLTGCQRTPPPHPTPAAECTNQEPAMGAATGHYGDLFVMRKHDPAHHQGDLSGIRRPEWDKENYVQV